MCAKTLKGEIIRVIFSVYGRNIGLRSQSKYNLLGGLVNRARRTTRAHTKYILFFVRMAVVRVPFGTNLCLQTYAWQFVRINFPV